MEYGSFEWMCFLYRNLFFNNLGSAVILLFVLEILVRKGGKKDTFSTLLLPKSFLSIKSALHFAKFVMCDQAELVIMRPFGPAKTL